MIIGKGRGKGGRAITMDLRKNQTTGKIKRPACAMDEDEDDDEDCGIDKYLADSDENSDSNGTFSDVEQEELEKREQELQENGDENDVLSLVDPTTEHHLRICKSFVRPTEEVLDQRAVKLGVPNRHKTLILDMDETLVHAMFHDTSTPPNTIPDCDFTFILPGEQGQKDLLVSVKERPYWKETLIYLSSLFELVVFTAGTQPYADAILDHMDKER